MTESLMVKCVHRATSGTIDFLLGRINPTQLTEKVLINATQNRGPDADAAMCRVAEACLHVPITIEILESAAQYVNLILFRFLWNRSRRSSIPEELIVAAAANKWPVMDFLLYEGNPVEIGEKGLAAIVTCQCDGYACGNLEILLEQGLQADTTEDVAATLLINEGINVKCSFPTNLKLSKGTKMTEDMFRIAASLRYERVLEKLTLSVSINIVPS